MSTFDVILHPTDFSEDSDQAFQLACSVARDQFAALVVVHVLPPESCPERVSDDEPINEEWPIVRGCHEKFCHLKALAGDIPISFRIVFGYSVGAILNVAHEEKADLIVIASHQHTRFHLQLHGSVAEGVLRQTHCPVLVLRQPAHRQASPESAATCQTRVS
jgi:nucleotide-binding universal stress UspA family protein